MDFAKIYNDIEVGQILIKIDSDENDCPEIRYFFKPKELGICNVAFSYKNSDEGWDTAEAVFEKLDKSKALHVVKGILKKI